MSSATRSRKSIKGRRSSLLYETLIDDDSLPPFPRRDIDQGLDFAESMAKLTPPDHPQADVIWPMDSILNLFGLLEQADDRQETPRTVSSSATTCTNTVFQRLPDDGHGEVANSSLPGSAALSLDSAPTLDARMTMTSPVSSFTVPEEDPQQDMPSLDLEIAASLPQVPTLPLDRAAAAPKTVSDCLTQPSMSNATLEPSVSNATLESKLASAEQRIQLFEMESATNLQRAAQLEAARDRDVALESRVAAEQNALLRRKEQEAASAFERQEQDIRSLFHRTVSAEQTATVACQERMRLEQERDRLAEALKGHSDAAQEADRQAREHSSRAQDTGAQVVVLQHHLATAEESVATAYRRTIQLEKDREQLTEALRQNAEAAEEAAIHGQRQRTRMEQELAEARRDRELSSSSSRSESRSWSIDDFEQRAADAENVAASVNHRASRMEQDHSSQVAELRARIADEEAALAAQANADRETFESREVDYARRLESQQQRSWVEEVVAAEMCVAAAEEDRDRQVDAMRQCSLLSEAASARTCARLSEEVRNLEARSAAAELVSESQDARESEERAQHIQLLREQAGNAELAASKARTRANELEEGLELEASARQREQTLHDASRRYLVSELAESRQNCSVLKIGLDRSLSEMMCLQSEIAGEGSGNFSARSPSPKRPASPVPVLLASQPCTGGYRPRSVPHMTGRLRSSPATVDMAPLLHTTRSPSPLTVDCGHTGAGAASDTSVQLPLRAQTRPTSPPNHPRVVPAPLSALSARRAVACVAAPLGSLQPAAV